MAMKANFVRINRYLDSAIPELGRARRDAIALWAMFNDSIGWLAECIGVDRASLLRAKPGIQGVAQ